MISEHEDRLDVEVVDRRDIEDEIPRHPAHTTHGVREDRFDGCVESPADRDGDRCSLVGDPETWL